MKVHSKNGIKIIIASPSGAAVHCPRLLVSGKAIRFRDDYHGSIKSSRKILNRVLI